MSDGARTRGRSASIGIRARRLAFAGAFLAGLAAGIPAVSASGEPAPAFGERSLHVLHVPFLDFGPADPRRLAPGKLVFSVEAAYASTFSSTWHAATYHRQDGLLGRPFTREEADRIHRDFPDDRVFFLASDLLRVAVTGRVGLSPEVSLSAELVCVSHDSIHGGSAFEAFHRAFGIDQPGRAEFPSDAYDVVVQRPGGPMTFDDRVPASGLGDTTLRASFRPPAGSRWSWGTDAAAKAPTGRARDGNGSGSWDAGALAFLRRDGTRWELDAEASFVAPGSWRSATGLRTAPFGRFLLGTARRMGDRTRLGASVTVEQSPFRREALGDLSHPGMEIALGVSRDARLGSASLTITENVPSFGDRADFGLVLRLRFF